MHQTPCTMHQALRKLERDSLAKSTRLAELLGQNKVVPDMAIVLATFITIVITTTITIITITITITIITSITSTTSSSRRV